MLLTLAWWAISEGQPAALWFGVLAVPAALVLSLRLAPITGAYPRPLPALRFAAWFLGASLLAGFDVAWRVLHPRLLVRPGLARVALRLPPGPPRLLLAGTIGLLPGSVAVSLEGDSMLLHQLNTRQDAALQVRDVERRIADLFGLGLEGGDA